MKKRKKSSWETESGEDQKAQKVSSAPASRARPRPASAYAPRALGAPPRLQSATLENASLERGQVAPPPGESILQSENDDREWTRETLFFRPWNISFFSSYGLGKNLCTFLFFSSNVERHRTVPHLKYIVCEYDVRITTSRSRKKCDGGIDLTREESPTAVFFLKCA